VREATRSAAAAAAVVAAILTGVAAGVGGYTFLYARGASYLTDNPAACANCHVMSEQLEGWIRSSHRHVAVCNDCHTPHALAGKYVTKARNGFWHSYAFTSGRFHEPIRMHETNRSVTEAACRRCHASQVHGIEQPGSDEPLSCTRCHAGVGHG
jgi:cytochrome c nitrite reductase small subunit